MSSKFEYVNSRWINVPKYKSLEKIAKVISSAGITRNLDVAAYNSSIANMVGFFSDKDKNSGFGHVTDILERQLSFIKEGDYLSYVRQSLFEKPFLVDNNSIRLAVLGDTHGRITKSLNYLAHWMVVSGSTIDGILQVGDIGAYDLSTNLDNTTKSIAEKEPEELGFKDYYEMSPQGDVFFKDGGLFEDTPFIFIDGNHDDINFLNSVYEVNKSYDNFKYLKSGGIHKFTKANNEVIVGGVGWYASKENINNFKEIYLDVLLTHNDSIAFQNDNSILLENIRIKSDFHFFGHKKDVRSYTEPGLNKFGLNSFKGRTLSSFDEGSLGIVEFNKEGSHFYYVPN